MYPHLLFCLYVYSYLYYVVTLPPPWPPITTVTTNHNRDYQPLPWPPTTTATTNHNRDHQPQLRPPTTTATTNHNHDHQLQPRPPTTMTTTIDGTMTITMTLPRHLPPITVLCTPTRRQRWRMTGGDYEWQGRLVMTRTGPNDASGVVWALGTSFFFSLCFFIY